MKAEWLFLIAVALCIANFLQSRELVRMANEIVKLRITVEDGDEAEGTGGERRMNEKKDYDIEDWLRAVPVFEDRGVEHTAPCPCGGTIHAIRSTYNGHIRAWCDKCDTRMMS